MNASLYVAVDKLFSFIQLIVFIRIALSWFPNINWWEQPFKLLNDVTEPILAPFRKLVPPIGGMDLSPMVAFLALSFLQNIALTLIQRIS